MQPLDCIRTNNVVRTVRLDKVATCSILFGHFTQVLTIFGALLLQVALRIIYRDGTPSVDELLKIDGSVTIIIEMFERLQ